MNKLILTDVDGTNLDWNSAFCNFMGTKGYPFVPGTEHNYDLMIRHNIQYDKLKPLMVEFNEGDHMRGLKPFADSVEHIAKLHNDGFRFIAITSLSANPKAKEYREENLKSVFGDVFDDVICLPMGMNKRDVLEKWKDTKYFWIEDHTGQAEAGIDAGLSTILINHDYNKHYTNNSLKKVSLETPWQEIYDIVTNHYSVIC